MSLSSVQIVQFLTIAEEKLSTVVTFEAFAEVVHDLLEDISGFECTSCLETECFVHHLWSLFMAKPQDNSAMAEKSVSPTIPVPGVELTIPTVKKAIQEGKAVRIGGGTKADAARAMFKVIHSESKEIIVAAFIEGADLTEKGALTYWYNCKRRASKDKSKV